MRKTFKTQPCLIVTGNPLSAKCQSKLDNMEMVLCWEEIEVILSPIYNSTTGCPSYPLLTLFRSLLLGVWYDLSDVQLSEQLHRDLLFRRFCRIELDQNAPSHDTLSRFRDKLRKHNLLEDLLKAINAQLEQKNIIMTTGRINIVDASPIEAHQSRAGKGKDCENKRDKDGGWHVGTVE